jgi:hypothetical protein
MPHRGGGVSEALMANMPNPPEGAVQTVACVILFWPASTTYGKHQQPRILEKSLHSRWFAHLHVRNSDREAEE